MRRQIGALTFVGSSRVAKIVAIITAAIAARHLSPSLAMSLVGKLRFTLESAFGRIGIAPLRVLVHHSYTGRALSGISVALGAALRFFLFLLPLLQRLPREVDFRRRAHAAPRRGSFQALTAC